MTSEELDQIASFTGMDIETLKKQDTKDLRRLWRQVKAELEERRVKIPTIELCISERARRSLSNQETPRIVVGSILSFSPVSVQSEAKEEADDSAEEQRVRVLDVLADSTSKESDAISQTSLTRDDVDRHEFVRLRVENAPLIAPISPDTAADNGSTDQPAVVEQELSSTEENAPIANKADNEEQPEITTLLVDMDTIRIVQIDGVDVELEFSCEDAREGADPAEASLDVSPEANVWMIKNSEGLWRQLGTVANTSVEEGYAKFLSTVDSDQGAKVHMYVSVFS